MLCLISGSLKIILGCEIFRFPELHFHIELFTKGLKKGSLYFTLISQS